MICCCRCVVNNFVALIDWKPDSNRLIYTKQMAKVIPSPWSFNHFICPININDVQRSNFLKAAKLARTSRTSLKPNYEGNCMVLPIQIWTLPKRIIDWCTFVLIIPINILVPRVCLDGKVVAELFVEKAGCVFESGCKNNSD